MATKLTNHTETAHAPTTLEKIKKVPVGRKLSEIDKTFGSTYRRLDPNKPSPTVTRSGYRDFIHPIYDRMLTVRELATLQSFPLDWEFFGVRLDSYSSKRKTTIWIGDGIEKIDDQPQLDIALRRKDETVKKGGKVLHDR